MRYRLTFDRSHWIDRAARLGHLATGSLYVLVGSLAFISAFDARSRPTDGQGALEALFREPAGSVAVAGIAVCMALDFGWQIIRAVTNADMAPQTWKGLADRAGWVLAGCVHLGLALSAAKIVLEVSERSADAHARATTAAVLAVPFGRWVIVVAAAAVIAVGCQMLRRAFRADVDRWLDLRSLPERTRAVVLALGRWGLAARGIVFCAAGAALAYAGFANRPASARALRGSLELLVHAPVGTGLLVVVTLGLVAFGAVEIVSARYRRIRVPVIRD